MRNAARMSFDELSLRPQHWSLERTDTAYSEAAGLLRTSVLAPRGFQITDLQISLLHYQGFSMHDCAVHTSRCQPGLPPRTGRFLEMLFGKKSGIKNASVQRQQRECLRFWRSVPMAAAATPLSLVAAHDTVVPRPPPPWKLPCPILQQVLTGTPLRCVLQDRFAD